VLGLGLFVDVYFLSGWRYAGGGYVQGISYTASGTGLSPLLGVWYDFTNLLPVKTGMVA